MNDRVVIPQPAAHIPGRPPSVNGQALPPLVGGDPFAAPAYCFRSDKGNDWASDLAAPEAAEFSGLEDGASRNLTRRLSRVRRELQRPFHDGLPADLPIRAVLERVFQSTMEFPFTVISSPTGSGKTIGVPFYFLTQRMGMVVTQPRIIAARGAASFLAECIGEQVGERIGYRTAKERCDSEATVCQYVTDGLEVMRLLRNPTRVSLGNRWALMVDEFHERNLNHDALLAHLVKLHRQGKLNVRVIISSATLDTDALRRHLGEDNCNVITCEGRMHPVEQLPAGQDPVEDGVELIARGEPAILHFVAGKREIHDRMDRYAHMLDSLGIDAVVLALHSELSAEQQQSCMRDHGKPKIIVCTNIAEAGLTVPGVTGVICEGLRRTIRTKSGVQGLYTERISNAESRQRAGRAGRTAPGVFISHHPLSEEERPNYPEPEITRLQLDNLVLRLRAQQHEPRELSFLNQPSGQAFDEADERLKILGCLDAGRNVTALGRRLADLSLSVNLGRMLFEAERVGVLKEAISVAAVVEAGGITELGNHNWRDLVPDRCRSDALAQYEVLKWAQSPLITAQHLEDKGVDQRGLAEASEHIRELEYKFRDALKNQRGSPKNQEMLLLQCLTAGFRTHAFIRRRDDWIDSRHGTKRELDSLSVISPEQKFIVGVPWDLNLSPGGRTRHLIRWATAVSYNELPQPLQKVARELDRRDHEPVMVHRRSPRFGH